MTYTKLLSIIILACLLVSSAYALEDFSITFDEHINVCPCSGQQYTVIITNTGSEVSTYTILATAENYPWAFPYAQPFTLSPNQRTEIPITVQSPCDVTGTGPFQFIVQTSKGLAKLFSQQYTFQSCYNLILEHGQLYPQEQITQITTFPPSSQDIAVCEKEQSVLPIIITNTDSVSPNRYDISFQGPDWVQLQDEQLELQPNQKGITFLSIDAPDQAQDIGNVTIQVVTQLGQKNEILDIPLAVEHCYDIEMEVQEPQVQCAGQKQTYDITVHNKGSRRQSVSMVIPGPNWTYISPRELVLNPNTQQQANLIIDAPRNVNDTLTKTIQLTTPTGNIDHQIKIPIVAHNQCFASQLQIPNVIQVPKETSYTQVSLINQGQQKTTYNLSVQGPQWASIEPSLIDLEPGTQYNTNVQLIPQEDVQEGTYEAQILVTYEGITDTYPVQITIQAPNSIKEQLDQFYKFYRYYIYVGIVVLAIILLAIYFIATRKDSSESKSKKE